MLSRILDGYRRLQTTESAWMMATLTARLILGLMLLVDGWWRCFGEQMSPKQNAINEYIRFYGGDRSWIPDWLLWGLGVTSPALELACGALIFVGLARRVAYTLVSAMLVVWTYGHLLFFSAFQITSPIFSWLALLTFLWLAPLDRDVLALDTMVSPSGARVR